MPTKDWTPNVVGIVGICRRETSRRPSDGCLRWSGLVESKSRLWQSGHNLLRKNTNRFARGPIPRAEQPAGLDVKVFDPVLPPRAIETPPATRVTMQGER